MWRQTFSPKNNRKSRIIMLMNEKTMWTTLKEIQTTYAQAEGYQIPHSKQKM